MSRLARLLGASGVHIGLVADSASDLLAQLVTLLVESGEIPVMSAPALEKALLAREQLGSTGLGGGIAVPHSYIEDLDHTSLLVATLEEPVDFGALDEAPVDLVFLLVGPASDEKKHLGLIARVARLLHDPGFVQELRAAKSPEEGRAAIDRLESRHP